MVSHWTVKSRVRAGLHPGQVATGPYRERNETNNHPHTAKGNLDSLINVTCMLLDSRWKLEHPEETPHIHGESNQTSHPVRGLNAPGTFVLLADRTNHCEVLYSTLLRTDQAYLQ